MKKFLKFITYLAWEFVPWVLAILVVMLFLWAVSYLTLKIGAGSALGYVFLTLLGLVILVWIYGKWTDFGKKYKE